MFSADFYGRKPWPLKHLRKSQKLLKNLQRAGMAPRSLTTDVGPEWSGNFARMLDSKGIISFQKRPEDKNAIATLDVAIGQLKTIGTRHTKTWDKRLGIKASKSY